MTMALAGCLADDDADDPYFVEGCQTGTTDDDGVNIIHPHDDVYVPALKEDGQIDFDQYDRWDFEATNYRTCTMPNVGYSSLREGEPHRYLGELDMRGDLDLGAVAVTGNGEAPMVYLVDISIRQDPIVVGTITQQDTYITDVKISDDGDYLFVASQTNPTSISPSNPTGSGVDTGFVDGGATTTPFGFSIYNIENPQNPSFLQTVFSPDERGCHMLSHEIIDDIDVVFCIGSNVHAYGLVRQDDGTPWVELGRFSYHLPDGDGASSELPSGCFNDEYWLNYVVANANAGSSGATSEFFDEAYANLCEAPHDMTVREDPVDGRILMSVSHWGEGVRIVDASNPVNDGFVTLAAWDGEGARFYEGNVHTAMTFWVGDKRYVVASPEYTSTPEVPSLWVLDATDLGDGSEVKQLELVAEWYHPAEIATTGYFVTTHQWQVAPTGPDVAAEDVTIYITLNHFGVWALDFAEILAGNNEDAIGGFHMSRLPLDPETDSGNAPLATWDVDVEDGFIYGSDRATGLWVFDYTGDAEDDPSLRGFA